MSQINAYQCDRCCKIADSKYNGEHWLPPQGWAQVVDVNTLKLLIHLCTTCSEKLLKKVKKHKV